MGGGGGVGGREGTSFGRHLLAAIFACATDLYSSRGEESERGNEERGQEDTDGGSQGAPHHPMPRVNNPGLCLSLTGLCLCLSLSLSLSLFLCVCTTQTCFDIYIIYQHARGVCLCFFVFVCLCVWCVCLVCVWCVVAGVVCEGGGGHGQEGMEVHAGGVVRIHSLERATQHNGAVGKAEGLDAANARWRVKILRHRSGVEISLCVCICMHVCVCVCVCVYPARDGGAGGGGWCETERQTERAKRRARARMRGYTEGSEWGRKNEEGREGDNRNRCT